MATDTAAPPSAARPSGARPDPTRNLWQVPVLLLGVGAFVSTWQGWIFGGDGPTESTKDLNAPHAA